MSRKDRISRLVEEFGPGDPMEPPAEGLPLAMPSFGREEVGEAISALLSGWITMGDRVRAFEETWADAAGSGQAIAVNSGSSALLVMLSALVECGMLERGQEVLLPAVGWSTSLFTLSQAGLVPVLVDVGEDSLCIEGERERPVLAIHMLGCPSTASSPVLIEDACGAHGAKLHGRTAGSLGISAAFSFFFSHHLTTGEGGMVTTSDPVLADACRSIRAHGWIRERSDRDKLASLRPDIDPRFHFATPGYNLRMTEVGGAFGIHQVPRLEGYVERRRANHRNWCRMVEDLELPLRVFPELPGTRHAAFAFPILLSEDCPLSRAELCGRLELLGIQTRPISGSHLGRQPAFKRLPAARVEGPTPVADAVHSRGFFVGQSHAFGDRQGELLAGALSSLLGS
jgi:CDP-4-dehydro-6-deoxyglucose reductase, E1